MILREEDWGSDSKQRVEDAVDDDEEVENRRRRRIGARASGRVAAGIGSSLEIAVGWLPHRLGRFIRGSLGGRSGERATRRHPQTGPEEDRLIVGNRAIVFPFYALRPMYNLRGEGGGERKKEKERAGGSLGGIPKRSVHSSLFFLFFPRGTSSSSSPDRVSSSLAVVSLFFLPCQLGSSVLFSRECVVQVSNAH